MKKSGKTVEEDGWFWSDNFNHYQKVKNKIYVYVTPQLFGRWIVQAYLRGTTGMCSLEARVEENQEIGKLFVLGNKWLELYGEDTKDMEEDPYNPFNRNGWLGENVVGSEIVYFANGENR